MKPDFQPHSFVIKIWLEETKTESDHAVWRGRITHVPSGKQYYFKNLREIAPIIAPYLRDMEVDLGLYWRIKLWLQQRSHWSTIIEGKTDG